jgi:hypothetical protein
MMKPFDIFWFGDNGPNWIAAVDTLEAARAQIEKLPEGISGSYAVLDQRTGNRISFAAKQPIQLRNHPITALAPVNAAHIPG